MRKIQNKELDFIEESLLDLEANIKNVKTYGANLEIFQSKSSVKEYRILS